MKHRTLAVCLFVILTCAAAMTLAGAQAPNAAPGSGEFRAWFIDVEGGQATLMISPTGESLLVDTGWADYNGRDADRIVAAAKAAGVKQIDYLWITHYHADHVGGVPNLAQRIPIIHFVDHGQSVEANDPNGKRLYDDYLAVRAKGRHILAKPGDRLPTTGMNVEIVSAAGQHLSAPVAGAPGAGTPNPYCQDTERRPADPSENAQSAGMVIAVGKFRMVDLGDLTWNKEIDLMCPRNPLGTADVYVVNHHGMNLSGSPALVDALGARVAIMDNGARKGGSPEAWKTIRAAPGLEDIWQLHYAVGAGDSFNAPEPFLANPGKSDADDRGYALELVAHPDSSFTVINTRNNYSKTYPAR